MRVNAPLVVHDEFDGEVLAVRNDTGTYYSMRGSGAVVWRALSQGADGGQVIDVVARAYGVTDGEVAADVEDFLARLHAEGLVVDDGASPPEAPFAVAAHEPYEPPALQAHTDMQDLLMFDPIHDVTPPPRPDDADAGGR